MMRVFAVRRGAGRGAAPTVAVAALALLIAAATATPATPAMATGRVAARSDMWVQMNASATNLAGMAHEATKTLLARLDIKDLPDLDPSTVLVTPDGSQICDPSSNAAAEAGGFVAMSSALGELFGALPQTESGAAFASEMQATAGTALSAGLKAMGNNAPVTGGGYGAGYGFSVECQGQVMFAWSMAAGAGQSNRANAQSGGFAGGGGAHLQRQPGATPLDFGGGFGCGTIWGGACASAGATGSTDMQTLMGAASFDVTSGACATQMQVCYGGGGGAAVNGIGCQWGAGFTWNAYKVERGPAYSCSLPWGLGNAGYAAHSCSAYCGAAPNTKQNYHDCYCPCLKSRVGGGGGARWAGAIQCR
mmetsp:Transcript_7891/g.27982  ORF Transcript_7891/g.27982 Transcript_7891/m.27982 type:complete len:363 (+) Transcript_7891:52-1140(+)